MLSRFRSHSEQKKVLQLLREGGVDIVIGTHRLISGDLVFKDLGLVVIDEEQRFGVLQKEKFKELFKLVDVLTLSATPIPRTLYLSQCPVAIADHCLEPQRGPRGAGRLDAGDERRPHVLRPASAGMEPGRRGHRHLRELGRR